MCAAIDQERRRLVHVVGLSVAAAKLGAVGSVAQRMSCAALRTPDHGAFPSHTGANATCAGH